MGNVQLTNTYLPPHPGAHESNSCDRDRIARDVGAVAPLAQGGCPVGRDVQGARRGESGGS
jgi:hypothetical protein